MPAQPLEYYSYEDYKCWDGDWELIGGIAYAMAPSPAGRHQWLVSCIIKELMDNLEDCEQCIVLADTDWIISDDTVVRPDISVLCEKVENYIVKRPEIIFEVISPRTARRDEHIKFEIYEFEKVPYYIIVYPDKLTARVFKLNNNKYEKAGEFNRETFLFEGLPCEIEVNFNNIFKRVACKK